MLHIWLTEMPFKFEFNTLTGASTTIQSHTFAKSQTFLFGLCYILENYFLDCYSLSVVVPPIKGKLLLKNEKKYHMFLILRKVAGKKY